MVEINLIKTKALEIIRDYMGQPMAQLYSDFYQKQEAESILESIKELLNEYVGKSRAHEILEKNGLIKMEGQ